MLRLFSITDTHSTTGGQMKRKDRITPGWLALISSPSIVKVLLISFLLSWIAFAELAFAGSGEVIFYYDKSYKPIVNLQRLPTKSDGMRAILAMYALQNGAGCSSRRDDGIQCLLTSALNLGTQCSEQHIRLVRTWFKAELPKMSGYEKSLYQDTQHQGGLESICYNTPFTATFQQVWDLIRVKQQNNHVLIDAHGVWTAREESGSFHYQTEYEIGEDTVTLITHKEIPSSEKH
jgi:hypothetical protein